jgi:hypothetical protein
MHRRGGAVWAGVVSFLFALGWVGPHSGTDNCPTSMAMSLDPGPSMSRE